MKVDIYDEDCVSEEEEVPEFFSGKNLKQIKQSIFENIVKGDFSNEEIEPTLKQLIENYNLSLGNQTGFFFTFLLQTLDWRLPVMAIHLSQSETGHISIREIANFKKLLYRLSKKQHFSVRYFAADGETGFNGFHQAAFDRYSSNIENVLNGEITIENFLNIAYSLCHLIPIIDILHVSKSGRNRLMNNLPKKLGENCDLFNSKSLETDLNIHNDILHDRSSIGRMKDAYPLHLFTLDNAQIEIGNGKKSAIFYLFLYSLIIDVFRNPFMKIDLRIMLSDFVLFQLLQLYKASNKLPSETSFRKNSRSQKKYVWFNDQIAVVKLINTMICVCKILRDISTPKKGNLYYFCLDRLSSHPVEQFFGQYRNHFFGEICKKISI